MGQNKPYMDLTENRAWGPTDIYHYTKLPDVLQIN
jgi:hypothetical protein